MFDQHMLEAEKLLEHTIQRLQRALDAQEVHSRRLHRRVNRLEKQAIKTCKKIRRS